MSRFSGRGVSLDKLIAANDGGNDESDDDETNHTSTIRMCYEKCKLKLKLIDSIVDSLQERVTESNKVSDEIDTVVDELKEVEEDRIHTENGDGDDDETEDHEKTAYIKYKELKLQLKMASNILDSLHETLVTTTDVVEALGEAIKLRISAQGREVQEEDQMDEEAEGNE
jgi:hypothetical protein